MKIAVCFLLLVTQVFCETSFNNSATSNKVAPSKSTSAAHTKGTKNGYIQSTQQPAPTQQNTIPIAQPMQPASHVRGVLVPVRAVQRPLFLIAQPVATPAISNGIGQHSEQFQNAVRELLTYYESNPQARFQLLQQQHGQIFNSPQYVLPTSGSQPVAQALTQLPVNGGHQAIAQLPVTSGHQAVAHLAIPANIGPHQTTATAYLIPAPTSGHQPMAHLISTPQQFAQQYQQYQAPQQEYRSQYQLVNSAQIAKSPNTEGMRVVPAPQLDGQRPNYIPTPTSSIPQYVQTPPVQAAPHHYIPQAATNQLHHTVPHYLAPSNSIAPNHPHHHFVQTSSTNNVPHYIPALANGQFMLGPGLYQALSQGNVQGVPQNHGHHGNQRHARDYMKSTATTPLLKSSYYRRNGKI